MKVFKQENGEVDVTLKREPKGRGLLHSPCEWVVKCPRVGGVELCGCEACPADANFSRLTYPQALEFWAGAKLKEPA